MPHACSPTMVRSLSSCSTALSWELLENAFIPAWKQVPKWGWWQLSPPAEVCKAKSLAWFDLWINPRASIFCEKHSAQNLFVDPFTVIQQAGHASPGYRNPRFKSIPWFSIEMLLRSKPNPTAQSEKDPPQTSQQSVHPVVRKNERSRPKSKLHHKNVVTQGLKAFFIFNQKFHPTFKQPARPTAWASIETLQF